MNIAKSIKKLAKVAPVVYNADQHHYEARYKGYVIAFHGNGGNTPETEVDGAMYRRENDHSDSMTDYCAWTFTDSIPAAIKRVDRNASYPTAAAVVASYARAAS